MAMEIVDLPMKNGDVPTFLYVYLVTMEFLSLAQYPLVI